MNITTDGTPGGLSTGTSIRGASSFRSEANGPLYVIDGVMTRENPGTILNSNDVESIRCSRTQPRLRSTAPRQPTA